MKAVVGLLLTAMWSVSPMAWADRARAPYDYVTEVAGGKYVLVMLATRGPGLLDPGAPDDVGVIEADKELRKVYKQSGLYLARQTEPHWTVPWYAFTVFPASDGDHLVRLGPWASSAEQLGIAFYSKGKEIRRYLIRDLVKDPSRLRRTVSHFFWMVGHEFDDKAGLFHLKTGDGQAYKFSILSGEMVP